MKLIKINTDHYIIVDNSEIKEGDYCTTHLNVIDVGKIHNSYTIFNPKNKEHLDMLKGCKKITHSTQPLNDNPHYADYGIITLREVKELLGEVDVEKKAEELTSHLTFPEERREGIIIGYNQALEDNKDKLFTVDDIKKAFEEGVDSEFMTLHMETYEQREHYRKTRLNTFIKSLPPKTEWEVEFDENSKLKLV